MNVTELLVSEGSGEWSFGGKQAIGKRVGSEGRIRS